MVWACDPLTMQDYRDQQLVGGWLPEEAATVPEQFRTADDVGVAVLYLVAVHAKGTAAPKSWSDLTKPAYAPVAVPIQGAASASGHSATSARPTATESTSIESFSSRAPNRSAPPTM